MQNLFHALALGIMTSIAMPQVHAQDGGDDEVPDEWDLESQVELGAVLTTGNTRDENLRFRTRVDADREPWGYRISFDGFRSSKDDELAAERFYTTGRSSYTFDDDHFIETRVAHERDRFSGFEHQTDGSLSYGQVLLREREDMELDYTIGGGLRNSRSELEDFNEVILRLATHYFWDMSDSARFFTELSVDAGDEISVTRSETGVESDLLDNLSMKFSVRLRQQSNVPSGRKKLDTESSITLMLRL